MAEGSARVQWNVGSGGWGVKRGFRLVVDEVDTVDTVDTVDLWTGGTRGARLYRHENRRMRVLGFNGALSRVEKWEKITRAGKNLRGWGECYMVDGGVGFRIGGDS
jgi:hypothetical protein